MNKFEYVDAPVPVRDDIGAAHRRAWQRLSEPGTWWTGHERVAIAAEVRQAGRCALCAGRLAALSPAALDGTHDGLGELPEAAVEVIHRVVTDPARLSRSWFEKILASGLGDARYVELIGVVVTVVSIDAFHRGLGVAPEPLPEPKPGEPSRVRPEAALEGAWVPLTRAIRRGNVVRALSLVPPEVRQLMDLSAAHYLPIQQVPNATASMAGLDRPQIELLAGRVSALNECFY